MQQSTAIALIASFWATVYLVDSFLKSNPHTTWYPASMNQAGVSVHLAQVRWYTTSLNRLFVRVGTSRPRFLAAWFTAGVVFGCVAMVASLLLLTMVVINTLSRQPADQQILVPVMPGVNLPMNQIVYYLLTLFICGVFHEVGHAVAAVREQVRVNGFGVFILALYPGAFVDVSTDQLQSLSSLRQLRVYSAGVWHNFVVAITALTLIIALPMLLAPFYMTGNAILVTGLVENSAVSGPRGLAVGDHVTSVDDCQVTSVSDWSKCVGQTIELNQRGFCVPLNILHQQDISVAGQIGQVRDYLGPTGQTGVTHRDADCCANVTSTHLCFTYNTRKSPTLRSACLPARSTSDRASCHTLSDCFMAPHSGSVSAPSVCVVPVHTDNSSRLVRVSRSTKQPMLFLGHPADLFYSVYMSDYIPRSSILPINLHYVVDTLCRYLVSLSGALAILNVVPCYALDGQWILMATLESLISRSHSRLRSALYRTILALGTSLLVTNIAIALWVLFVR